MRLVFLLVLLAAAASGAHAKGPLCTAQSTDRTVALVELYTSEGCDSCPPADRWLSSLGPGGYAPDHMRRCEPMIRLVSTMAEQGKVVAAICHGPWMLCSTQALKGRKATCFVAVKDDVINAGAKYVDAEVIRDGNIITSRKPDDLPAFTTTIIQAVREMKPAMAGVR